MPKKVTVDRRKLKYHYLTKRNRLPVVEVARRFDMTPATLYRKLRLFNVPLRRSQKQERNRERDSLIKLLANAGQITLSDLGRRHGLSKQRIYQISEGVDWDRGRECLFCGTEFFQRQRTQKYCSRKCKDRQWYEEHKI